MPSQRSPPLTAARRTCQRPWALLGPRAAVRRLGGERVRGRYRERGRRRHPDVARGRRPGHPRERVAGGRQRRRRSAGTGRGDAAAAPSRCRGVGTLRHRDLTRRDRRQRGRHWAERHRQPRARPTSTGRAHSAASQHSRPAARHHARGGSADRLLHPAGGLSGAHGARYRAGGDGGMRGGPRQCSAVAVGRRTAQRRAGARRLHQAGGGPCRRRRARGVGFPAHSVFCDPAGGRRRRGGARAAARRLERVHVAAL